MKPGLIIKPFTPSAVAEGRIKCIVVDAKTKKTVREYPWQKNLILNHAFDYQFTVGGINLWGLSDMLSDARVGDGTTPTQDDSGATTATQVGTDVTLSGGSFVFTNTSTDAGKVIKWDSGEESTIVTVVSPTEVTVLEDQSVSAEEFTVYRTNQTTLANQLKTTNTKVAGANGTDQLAPHQSEFYRTYEFSAEAADVTYTEFGAKYLFATPDFLSVRVLFATPVSLIAGQQLRVVHRMRYTWSPATKLTDVDDLITGWPAYPVASQMCEWGIEWFSVRGADSNGNANGDGYLEPRQLRLNFGLYASTSNTAVRTTPELTAFNMSTSGDIGAAVTSRTFPTYVQNSFTHTYTFVFTPAWGESTAIRSLAIAGGAQSGVRSVLARIRFYEEQTKLNTHRLLIPIRISLARVLS
jgi:hypothetical protein